MSITIKDVAKKVGVTPATVSMVINNKPRISAETRRKVFEAIQELDYFPHEGARNLVLKRSNVIGVVGPAFTSYFAMATLDGIEGAMRDTNYNLLLFHPQVQPAGEETVISRIARERKVDGLIAMNMSPADKELGHFRKNHLALVSLETELEGFDCVALDNRQGAYDATKYLLAQGHRRLALLAADENAGPICQRENGFRQALKEAGIDFSEDYLYRAQRSCREDGVAAVKQWLALPQPPTAIFSAAGDLCAVGVLNALRDFGIEVPAAISVVGFDDQPFAELLEPALTTVCQPMAKMGAEALKLLKSAIAEGEGHKPQKVTFEASLVIRKSSGPAA